MKKNSKVIGLVAILLLIFCIYGLVTSGHTGIENNTSQGKVPVISTDINENSDKTEVAYEDILKYTPQNENEVLPSDRQLKIQSAIMDMGEITSVKLIVDEKDNGSPSVLVEMSLSGGRELLEDEQLAIKKIIVNASSNIAVENIEIHCFSLEEQ